MISGSEDATIKVRIILALNEFSEVGLTTIRMDGRADKVIREGRFAPIKLKLYNVLFSIGIL